MLMKQTVFSSLPDDSGCASVYMCMLSLCVWKRTFFLLSTPSLPFSGQIWQEATVFTSVSAWSLLRTNTVHESFALKVFIAKNMYTHLKRCLIRKQLCGSPFRVNYCRKNISFLSSHYINTYHYYVCVPVKSPSMYTATYWNVCTLDSYIHWAASETASRF